MSPHPSPANGTTALSGPGPPHYRGFTVTLRHTTLGTTPLDKWSARRRALYVTTHNTHKRQASVPPAGFEPTIPANERSQTQTLDHEGTGFSRSNVTAVKYWRLRSAENVAGVARRVFALNTGPRRRCKVFGSLSKSRLVAGFGVDLNEPSVILEHNKWYEFFFWLFEAKDVRPLKWVRMRGGMQSERESWHVHRGQLDGESRA
jgi:hypothetical protein